MKIKFILIFLFSVFLIQKVSAQDSSSLSFNRFYDLVLRNHPVALQAGLLPEMARSEIRTARGSFDPILQSSIENKTTKGVNSYQYFEPQIKIPTLIGLDFKAGMDQSSGVSVSPEHGKFDPSTGGTQNVNYQLLYAGMNLPVLRGLITDQRRIGLRQAELLSQMNQAEQVKVINKLLISASKDFWNWQSAFQKNVLMKKNYELAETRLNFIKNRIKGGEEKPIDSVEAWTELKRREVLLVESTMELLNARISLSNYLWDEQNNPIQIADFVYPSSAGNEIMLLSKDSLAGLLAFAENSHPEVRKLSLKINHYQFDRKLALENLKPQLNLEYYPFQTYTNGSEDVVPGLFYKNYKFGMTFYSSLFLRKERGKLQLTNLKIKDSELEFQQGRREVVNQVLLAYNEMDNFRQLVLIQRDLVINATLLRDAEEIRFEAGESSLFLVNQRERTLIEAQAKLVELEAKYAQSKNNLQFVSGRSL
jgi:outer membrane protein TolC